MSDVDSFSTIKEALRALDFHATVTVDTKLSDLDMDSLDAIELAMAVEEALGIEIPDEKTPDVEHTLGEFAKVVDSIRSATN